jgi:endonuclease/exonuclease/phosphatase (EEP) superfamily protein YafD
LDWSCSGWRSLTVRPDRNEHRAGNRINLANVRRTLLSGIGVLACSVAGIALLARSIEVTNHVVMGVAVLSPYLMLGAALGLVAFLAARRWLLAGISVALTLIALVVQLPAGAPSAIRARDHVDVRIVSANLYLGQADSQAVVALARDYGDVVAVQELTPSEMDRLSAAGMDASFPYRVVSAQDDAHGAGLWSRYPLTEVRRSDPLLLSLITARVQIPGVQTSATLAVVHTSAPWPWPIDIWRDGTTGLAAAMRQMARSSGGGAVVVAGDFNATRDMLQFRQLQGDGFEDAHEQVGAVIAPTYPADSWLPPLLTLDHVLTRGAMASTVRTATIAGSDHRALLTTVAIPRRPAP